MNLLKRITKNNGDEAMVPAQGLARFREEMEKAFERAWKSFQEPWSDTAEFVSWPAIDIGEDEKALTVRVDVPGLEAKDIEVDVSGNLVTVRGSREEESKKRNGSTYRHERHSGQFTRTVTLPTYADANKIEAKYEKGVLTITAPKIPGQGPKRVPVKSA